MGMRSFIQSMIPRSFLNMDLPGNIRLFTWLGNSLDWVSDLVNKVKVESRVLTAVDTIPTRESEFGIVSDPSILIEIRRASIIARMRDQCRPVTKNDLLNSIASYGVTANLKNNYAESIMTIIISTPPGLPTGFEQMKSFVREFTRSHVEIAYEYRYLMIAEVEAMTVAEIEATTQDKFEGGGLV